MTTGDETIATLTVALAGARTEAIAYKRERDAIHSLRNEAIAAERAACAKLADRVASEVAELDPDDRALTAHVARLIAERIRARGRP